MPNEIKPWYIAGSCSDTVGDKKKFTLYMQSVKPKFEGKSAGC